MPYYVFEARGLDLFYVLVRFRIAFGTSYNRFESDDVVVLLMAGSWYA